MATPQAMDFCSYSSSKGKQFLEKIFELISLVTLTLINVTKNNRAPPWTTGNICVNFNIPGQTYSELEHGNDFQTKFTFDINL